MSAVDLLAKEVNDVKRGLADHVRHCARWQKAAFGIGCTTLGMVSAENPKVTHLIGEILRALL